MNYRLNASHEIGRVVDRILSSFMYVSFCNGGRLDVLDSQAGREQCAANKLHYM